VEQQKRHGIFHAGSGFHPFITNIAAGKNKGFVGCIGSVGLNIDGAYFLVLYCNSGRGLYRFRVLLMQ
jgi:hypothetical protein